MSGREPTFVGQRYSDGVNIDDPDWRGHDSAMKSRSRGATCVRDSGSWRRFQTLLDCGNERLVSGLRVDLACISIGVMDVRRRRGNYEQGCTDERARSTEERRGGEGGVR